MKLPIRFAVLVISTAALIFMIGQMRRVNLDKKEVKVQVQRQLLVRDGCKSYSNETQKAEMEQHFGIKNYAGGLLDNIFVIDKYKMLYCVVPKSGSTAWMKYWVFATGKSKFTSPESVPEYNIHKNPNVPRLRKFPLEGQRRRLATYKKYLVVRHPFMRLVSAFVDKFKSKDRYYKNVVAPMILKRFRSNDTSASPSNVTFEEFARWVIDERSSGDFMDIHWKPARDLCQPCLVDYDLICKFETLSLDSEDVLKEANVPADIPFPVRAGVTSQINTQKYFSELSPQTFRQLADIYRDDFNLFGYDPNVLSTN